MPNPDGTIENRDLADKSVTTRLLDDDLTLDGVTTVSKLVVSDRATIPQIRVGADDALQLILSTGTAIAVIFLGTGDGDQVGFGTLQSYVTGSGATRTIAVQLEAPSFLDSDGPDIQLISQSFDDSTFPPRIVVSYDGGSTQTAEMRITDGIKLVVEDGELVIPAVTADPSSPADGNMWLHTVDNALYIWEGGAKRTVASW